MDEFSQKAKVDTWRKEGMSGRPGKKKHRRVHDPSKIKDPSAYFDENDSFKFDSSESDRSDDSPTFGKPVHKGTGAQINTNIDITIMKSHNSKQSYDLSTDGGP